MQFPFVEFSFYSRYFTIGNYARSPLPRKGQSKDDPNPPQHNSTEIIEEYQVTKETPDEGEAAKDEGDSSASEEGTDEEGEYNSDGDQVFHITDIFDTSTGKSFFA